MWPNQIDIKKLKKIYVDNFLDDCIIFLQFIDHKNCTMSYMYSMYLPFNET